MTPPQYVQQIYIPFPVFASKSGDKFVDNIVAEVHFLLPLREYVKVLNENILEQLWVTHDKEWLGRHVDTGRMI